ncbi:prepilin-type N-terminal cleavage/methylation domain-containing protein [Pseudomonas sp. BN515]|nr:prepilin-type N-terminal cleavage/methylation domain-containing protein [Pseudomonas sp. BN515]
MNGVVPGSSSGQCSSSSSQSGFSLVELMVAVTVSLLMMAAILKLFVDVARTNTEMEKTNAQIENGRFAIQLIAEDLVHGGFWNGYIPQFDDLTSTAVPADLPDAVPEPCLAYSSWGAAYKKRILGISLQTYDAVPTGCSAVVQNKKDGTDVVVVRRVENCVPGTANCEAEDAAKVYFQFSRCSTESPYAYVLSKSGFTLQKRNCLSTALAEKRKYVSNIYFVRDDNTLMRAEFTDGGGSGWNVQPIVDGVEGLVVELGVDSLSDSGAAINYAQAVTWANPLNKVSPTNRGDGVPDGSFIRCTTASPCGVNELVNIVAARIYVLVRSTEASLGHSDSKTYKLGSTDVGPFNDGFKRHVYTTTVRLNNVAGRRETP